MVLFEVNDSTKKVLTPKILVPFDKKPQQFILNIIKMTRHKSDTENSMGAYDVTRLLLANNGVDISKKNNAGLTARLMANGNYPFLRNTLFNELTKRRVALLSCAKHDECVFPYEVLRTIAEYLHLELEQSESDQKPSHDL